MIYKELLVLFIFIVVLFTFSGVAFVSVLKSMERDKKFQARVRNAVDPDGGRATVVEEEISLSRTVSPSQRFKEKAAGIIGVDLNLSETYPIKWWLVPPIAFLVSFGLVFLAAHPFDQYKVPLYFIAFPVVGFVLTKAAFGSFHNKRNGLLLQQFPDALNTIVRCVRVGIPIGEALRTVSRDAPEPTKTEFHTLADKVTIGIPLDAALRELAMRIKLTEYQFFATALTLQARSGGGITQTLETLAEVIRKRVALKARGFALTAEARTSAMILSCLPFLAGTAIFFMQRPYILLLFFTKSGQSVLALAMLMMGVGMGIIQYMINSVLK
jgi:tight adherence protein B